MLDRAGCGLRRLSRLVVLGHALLERLDALGEVTHHIGNAALAEHQHHHDDQDQPVPYAERAHGISPHTAQRARLARASPQSNHPLEGRPRLRRKQETRASPSEIATEESGPQSSGDGVTSTAKASSARVSSAEIPSPKISPDGASAAAVPGAKPSSS